MRAQAFSCFSATYCRPVQLLTEFKHQLIANFWILTGADTNLRDYSGKKPYQYLPRQGTSISSDTFRSEYSYKSPFDRGGLYSSLRNSLLKFTPAANLECSCELKTASPDCCNGENHHRDFDRRIRTLSKSFLREFRPSIRKRASMNEFANYTT